MNMNVIDAGLIGAYGGLCNILFKIVARKLGWSSKKRNIFGLVATVIGSIIYAAIGFQNALILMIGIICSVYSQEIKKFLSWIVKE